MSRPMSPETRAKISAAKIGKPGRKHTPEALAKMRAAKVGRKLSAEHRASLSKAKLGKKLSPEHKAAMSAGQRKSASYWSAPPGFESLNQKLTRAGIPLAERRAAVDAAARQSSLHRSL